MSESRKCFWKDDEGGPWETGCGRWFECIEDGPEENGFKFCCYCGGELVVVQSDEIEHAERQGEG